MCQSHVSSLKDRIFTQVILLIMLMLITVSGAHGFMGEVTDVNSGDTLVADVQGQKFSIRLYGIDAPESGQHGSNAAKRYLRKLTLAHPIEVEVIETDVFGIALAIVRRVGKESSINAAIVANGYAWVNPKLCRADVCDKWTGLQRQARKYGLGIWSGFDLIPPWEFNSQEGR